MKQYIIARGIEGVLVGDPSHPQRFLCQRKLSWKKGEMPKAMHHRYEPVVAVYETKRAREAVRKGGIHQLAKLMAASPDEAMAQYEKSTPAVAAPPARPSRSKKSKSTKVEESE